MNAVELKAYYEAQLERDLEPPVADHVNVEATRLVLRASRRLPPGELREAGAPETWAWSDLELDDPESVRVYGDTEPWDHMVFRRWVQYVQPDHDVVVAGNAAVSGLSRRNLTRVSRAPARRKILVVGPHEADRRGVVDSEGWDVVRSTLYAPGDPPLLITHIPLWRVPPGCVNLHGHLHPQRMPAVDRHIGIAFQALMTKPMSLAEARWLAADLLAKPRDPHRLFGSSGTPRRPSGRPGAAGPSK